SDVCSSDLDETPRHGKDQCHRHVGGILGQHARGVGDGDAEIARGFDVDVIDAGAEVGDELEVRAGLAEDARVDAVCYGGNQDVGRLDRLDQVVRPHGRVIDVQPGREQLAHAGLDDVGKLARDDHERL